MGKAGVRKKASTSRKTERPAARRETDAAPSVMQLDRLMYYAALALLIVVPLVISRITFDQFDIAKLAVLRPLVLVWAGLWVAKVLKAKNAGIRWTKIDWFLAAFLVLLVISTAVSIHLPTAVHGKYKRYEGLLTFLVYGALYFLTLQTVYNFKRLKRVAAVISVVGGAAAVYGLIQYAGADPLRWASLPFEERRAFSSFGNPDLFAGFLVLVLPVSLAAFLAGTRREAAVQGVALLLIFTALIATFTRGAWAGAFVGAVVFLALAGRSILEKRKRGLVAAGVLVLVFGALAFYSQTSAENPALDVMARLRSAFELTQGSAASRLEIWKGATAAIRDRPLFGGGPDTFRLLSEHYETLDYVRGSAGRTVADNAHNYLFQLAAGSGLLPTAAVLLFLGGFFWFAVRGLRGRDQRERIVLSGLIAATAGYLVHLFFGISVIGSSAVLWVMMGTILGQTAAVRELSFEPRGQASLAPKLVLAGFVLVVAISAYFGVRMYAGDYTYVQAIKAATRGDLDGTISAHERAIELYPNGRYYDSLGAIWEQLGESRQDEVLFKRGIDVYRAAKKQEPREVDHRAYLANAYMKAAQAFNDSYLPLAERELTELLEIRPYSNPGLFMMASLLQAKGDYEHAIEKLELLLMIDPQSAPANKLLAGSLEATGRAAKALDYYRRAQELDPSDAETTQAIARLTSTPAPTPANRQ